MTLPNSLLAGLLAVVCGVSQAQVVKSVADFKAEAEAAVQAISVDEAERLIDTKSVIFIDVREGDEVESLGMIEGAVHVPRGVLEFYIDPASSMHMEIFSAQKTVVFYCATGGRSLLAAKLAKDMGVNEPVYLEGGFKAWAAAEISANQ